MMKYRVTPDSSSSTRSSYSLSHTKTSNDESVLSSLSSSSSSSMSSFNPTSATSWSSYSNSNAIPRPRRYRKC